MPLLSKKIAIDAVGLDGAKLSFCIQYADNQKPVGTKCCEKLNSQPEESLKNCILMSNYSNITNSASFDDKDETQGQLENLLVQAADIDLTKAFLSILNLIIQQKMGRIKTLVKHHNT